MLPPYTRYFPTVRSSLRYVPSFSITIIMIMIIVCIVSLGAPSLRIALNKQSTQQSKANTHSAPGDSMQIIHLCTSANGVRKCRRFTLLVFVCVCDFDFSYLSWKSPAENYTTYTKIPRRTNVTRSAVWRMNKQNHQAREKKMKNKLNIKQGNTFYGRGAMPWLSRTGGWVYVCVCVFCGGLLTAHYHILFQRWCRKFPPSSVGALSAAHPSTQCSYIIPQTAHQPRA